MGTIVDPNVAAVPSAPAPKAVVTSFPTPETKAPVSESESESASFVRPRKFHDMDEAEKLASDIAERVQTDEYWKGGSKKEQTQAPEEKSEEAGDKESTVSESDAASSEDAPAETEEVVESEEVVVDKKPVAAREPSIPKSIPYSRFKEVVAERNALREKAGQGADPQPAKEQVQVSQAGTDEMQLPDIYKLSVEQQETLRSINPQAYEKWRTDRDAHIVAAKVEKTLAAKQREQDAFKEVQQYVSHYDTRIVSEFPDIMTNESSYFKEVQPRFKELADEYPAITMDRGVQHLALRLIETERALKGLSPKVRGEVEKQIKEQRAAKKSSAMAGQARTIPSPPRKMEKIDDFFAGSPKFTNRQPQEG